MTDELDPQTQQHIDDSADVITDTDTVTCDDIDIDDSILDESATAETPETENADEQNDDAAAQEAFQVIIYFTVVCVLFIF